MTDNNQEQIGIKRFARLTSDAWGIAKNVFYRQNATGLTIDGLANLLDAIVRREIAETKRLEKMHQEVLKRERENAKAKKKAEKAAKTEEPAE